MTIVAALDKDASTPTPDALRDAMRQLASGVSIVTAGRDKEWTAIVPFLPRHSHLIAIGQVLCVDVKDRPDSLQHWRGGYARLPASSVIQS